MNINNFYEKLDFIDSFKKIIKHKEFVLTGNLYNINNYDDDLFFQYEIDFPECIKQSVKKRKSEFLAGRIAARESLVRLNPYYLSAQVGVGKHRRPIWPSNTIGSLSHTTENSVCISSFSSIYMSLGIDIETIIKLETMQKIHHSVLDGSELELVKNASQLDEIIFTIIFSAKETFFKTLFPIVKKYFYFDAAKVTNIDFKNNTYSLVTTKNIGKNISIGEKFTGYFMHDKKRVITAQFIPKDYECCLQDNNFSSFHFASLPQFDESDYTLSN